MLTLTLSGVVFAAFSLLIWLMRRDTLERGKTETQAETYEHVLENVKKANAVRDRLKSDASYAERVSDRFTRK
jgi:hypothetical protein